MPDLSKTAIIIILDRSGSMQPIARDMEGGLRAFIEDQKKVPGSATVSLYQFNHRYEVCFENKPLSDVPEIHLRPRGITALLDAVGRTVNSVGEQLSALNDADRPGSVVVLVITDGRENASTKFNKVQIKRMVEHQKEKYRWQFAYLGSDPSTFREAGGIGMAGSSWSASPAGARAVMDAASRSVDGYRVSRGAGKLDATLVIDKNIPEATSGS